MLKCLILFEKNLNPREGSGKPPWEQFFQKNYYEKGIPYTNRPCSESGMAHKEESLFES